MMEFPAYRKIEHADVYFKIIDGNSFVELKKMGKYYFEEEFIAQIYPDKLRIQEMLEGELPFQKISQSDYDSIRLEWSKNLIKSSF